MRESEINNRIFDLDIERNHLIAEKKKLQFESVLPELRELYENNFYASADSHETQGTFFHVLRVVSRNKVEAMVLENYHHQVTLTLCKEIDMEFLEVRIAAFDFFIILEDAKNKFNYESN
jgi:hypothetical protein